MDKCGEDSAESLDLLELDITRVTVRRIGRANSLALSGAIVFHLLVALVVKDSNLNDG